MQQAALHIIFCAPSLQVRCIILELDFGAELTLTHKQSGARSINLSFNLL